MSIETPTTLLQAVNFLLKIIEEEPVSALVGDADDPDVEDAVQIIGQESRSLQGKGWYFNTEEEITLTPTGLGTITVPANSARITVQGEKVTVRKGKLYSLTRKTNRFTSPVTATVIYFLSFDDLPEVARRLIYLRAALTFLNRAPDPELEANLTRAARDAILAFEQEETELQDLTMTNSSNIAQLGT